MYVYIQLSSYISYTCYVCLPLELMILSEELKKETKKIKTKTVIQEKNNEMNVWRCLILSNFWRTYTIRAQFSISYFVGSSGSHTP